ncbi:hypothetical protein M0651_16255 [Paenibacillus sp. MBLB2552]|uniref:Uncharacterized protein n=1 Tax=Paenibacillus mellifer TaxID=2937794 RepID=A0A9X1XZS7_9BACL|nr:hypothetical protein [Paenibacillus mellifer]MCK8488730.1 hypothetical protein [Paenibacillus mellifer]
MENQKFMIEFCPNGNVSKLILKNDPHKMNWVIDKSYLEKVHYDDKGKLFGNFSLSINGKNHSSHKMNAKLIQSKELTTVTYVCDEVELLFKYDLSQSADSLFWTIELNNRTDRDIYVSDFGVWSSLAYVMYRINDLNIQTNHSTAIFPSVSKSFTKLACVRRSNHAPHLGIYQLNGETKSVGTYCQYENLFFENVSPSLDGILFHQLVFAGGYPEGFANSDWIYSKDGFSIKAKEQKDWRFAFEAFDDQDHFYQVGKKYGHPVYHFEPLAITKQPYDFSFSLPADISLRDAYVEYKDLNETCKMLNIMSNMNQTGSDYQATLIFEEPGEHKILIELDNGKMDSVIINVMKPIQNIFTNRARYISNVLYSGPEGNTPYSYSPVSNQGESLGKLSFVLKKNLLGNDPDISEVQKVEESCVLYIRPKWFVNGDFLKPAFLYGDFYRCMDFEYIGHVFYLLSRFDQSVLKYNNPDTYLEWAAEVFRLRVNPDLHHTVRGKEEARMLGTFSLYIDGLLDEMKKRGLTDKYHEIHALWSDIAANVAKDSDIYKAAVTEHFYDNAGFGPAAGALASSGHIEAAQKYGELLLANIGFSNDFRAQNPDRWWEALSYMIHSLWGGLTAAATLKVYEKLHDTRFLKAAYRATAGILYCYDTEAKATDKRLNTGEAASTYSVAGPNMNRPDLSRNRFGQSTFYRDGGIFSKLFSKEEETSDWDMGEELAAYLDGFGKKTFLYEEDNQIKVINGCIEYTDQGLLIRSYAPYPTEYHFYDADSHFISQSGEIEREVLYAEGRFISLKKAQEVR